MQCDEEKEAEQTASSVKDVDVESLAAWPVSIDAEFNSVDIQDEVSSKEEVVRRNQLGQSLEHSKSAIGTNILTRTLSRKSTASQRDPGPPPDGGLTAWTQVVAAHLCIFQGWGFITSYGVFQVGALNQWLVGTNQRPVLLHRDIAIGAVRHLLARLSTDLPAVLPRHLYRSST